VNSRRVELRSGNNRQCHVVLNYWGEHFSFGRVEESISRAVGRERCPVPISKAEVGQNLQEALFFFFFFWKYNPLENWRNSFRNISFEKQGCTRYRAAASGIGLATAKGGAFG